MSNDAIHALMRRLLDPDYFSAPGVRLAAVSGTETIPWEVFQGRLVPSTQARESRTFICRNVHVLTMDGLTPEPVISLKADADCIHVVRAVESEVWEGDGSEIIESVRRRRWTRELVASVPLKHPRLEKELSVALERAFTGSPLPLMPEESPHPLYSFGLLAYQSPGPLDGSRLEFLVRSIRDHQLPRVLAAITEVPPGELLLVLKQLFLGVSLSPWTGFIPRLFDLIEQSHLSTPDQAGFHSWLLALLCRHLTAYDLISFHFRGANYPDALVLDESLSRLMRLLQNDPSLAGRRVVRRAIRQAWLLRRQYEGHAVPDTPTSPGEQDRVFPGGHPRVSDEQLTDTRSRHRRLFTQPVEIPEGLLRASIEDLEHPDERQELGAAVFLDRPLGAGKAAVEPDATPLLATLAFSRMIATSRLHALLNAGLLTGERLEVIRRQLEIPGVPLSEFAPSPRPASVTLADAARVAPDFVFVRTLAGSIRRFQNPFDWTAIPPELLAGWRVIALSPGGGIMVHGPGLLLVPDLSTGYAFEGGTEYPVAGLLWGEARIHAAYQR